MKKEKTPPILYKYMSFESAEKVLMSNLIKVTPPNEFNDPFDILPGGYSGDTKKAAESYCTTNPEKFENKLKNRKFTELQNKFSKDFGIISLSENKNNILMWSHYADNHKGVVIGFKTEKFDKIPMKVEYKNERVNIPLDDEKAHEYRQAVLNTLKTKYKDWIYENEYRCLLELKNCTENNGMYFMELKGSITKVVSGFNMNNINKDIIKLIVTNNFQELTVEEAKLDNREFKINIS